MRDPVNGLCVRAIQIRRRALASHATSAAAGKGDRTSGLRRFAISVINLHANPADSVTSISRRLAAKTCLDFEYLLMTRNSTGRVTPAQSDEIRFILMSLGSIFPAGVGRHTVA